MSAAAPPTSVAYTARRRSTHDDPRAGAGSTEPAVGLQQQRLWHRKAENPGRLEVDGQFQLRRLLDRKVAGLGSLEDLVDVGGGLSYLVVEVRGVRHEAARLDELAFTPDRRDPGFRCQFYQNVPVGSGQKTGRPDQRVCLPSSHRGKRAV